MNIIVDSHCHITHQKFKDAGLTPAHLVAQAKAANVMYLNTICCTDAEFEEIHTTALTHPEVFCTYGIHPHHAGEESITYQDIIQKSSREKVIGIGESGLDYHYNYVPKATQQKSFQMHLEAAAELNIPLVIHTRSAEKDTANILENHLKVNPEAKILFHCFSSNAWLADWGIEHGLYFGASGIVTFKNSVELQAIFGRVPLEKLLVETDAPYLAPTPYRSKICTPAHTAVTLQFLADLRAMRADDLALQTTQNFCKLFPKAGIQL